MYVIFLLHEYLQCIIGNNFFTDVALDNTTDLYS